MAKSITSREKDYSQWYIDIVKNAELAENSAVRGCMVIKPYGYAIWEKMRDTLDKMFKETDTSMHIFPFLFRNLSFQERRTTWKGLQKSVQW